MLRMIKLVLSLSVALWGLLGVIGNVTDWAGTTHAVATATSMRDIPPGSPRWQATTQPGVILAGALFIVAFKSVTAVLCLTGSWRMWSNRRTDAEAFARAKALALAGCAVAVFGLFIGWIDIGEGWYQIWNSDALREKAAAAAFRYGGFIALISLMIGARDD